MVGTVIRCLTEPRTKDTDTQAINLVRICPWRRGLCSWAMETTLLMNVACCRSLCWQPLEVAGSKERRAGEVRETLNSALREITLPVVSTGLETKGRDSPSGCWEGWHHRPDHERDWEASADNCSEGENSRQLIHLGGKKTKTEKHPTSRQPPAPPPELNPSPWDP